MNRHESTGRRELLSSCCVVQGLLCPGLGLPDRADLLRRCHGSRVIGLQGRWRKHAAHPMFLNRPLLSTAFDPMPRGPRQRCPEGAASNFVPTLPCISAPEICSQSRACALQNNGGVAEAGRVDWLDSGPFSKQEPCFDTAVRMTGCPPANVSFDDVTGRGGILAGKGLLFQLSHGYLYTSGSGQLQKWRTAGSCICFGGCSSLRATCLKCFPAPLRSV